MPVLIAGGACVNSAGNSPPLEQPSSEPIVFPVQEPVNSVMQALLRGTLTQRGRCLYVSSQSRPKSLALPVWPEGFSYESNDGSIRVLDAEGSKVAETGSPVSIGGGLRGEGEAPLTPDLMERVESCEGPYWIVGEINKS